MKLNNKIYCDVCCKRIDNYTDPINCVTYGIQNQERHYCMKHAYIGKKLHEISKTNRDSNPFILPPLKMNTISKKMKRIYEDDNFVIDLFPKESIMRVSIFDDGHFKDEVFIKKSDYTGYLGSC